MRYKHFFFGLIHLHIYPIPIFSKEKKTLPNKNKSIFVLSVKKGKKLMIKTYPLLDNNLMLFT